MDYKRLFRLSSPPWTMGTSRR